MFTGTIREIGVVERVQRREGLVRLAVRGPRTAAKVVAADSVAVSGVCLTAAAVRAGVMTFEVVPETLRLTTLGRLAPGTRVNLEPSLSLADRLGGHLVFGHVDGTGRVVGRQARGGELVLTIQVPAACRGLIVPKGPLAVDGVSLTVGPQVTNRLTLHLIPETRRRTTLAERRVGEWVNLEADYVAKLIRQHLRARHRAAR